MLAPMPFEAPVTIATLPLRSLMDCSVPLAYGSASALCAGPSPFRQFYKHRTMVQTAVLQEGEKGSDFRQAIEIGAQHAAVEKEIGEFSLADDFDQARGLEF